MHHARIMAPPDDTGPATRRHAMIERTSKFEILVDALNLVLGTFLVLAPWTFGLVAGFPGQSQTTAVLDACAAGTTIGLTAVAALVAFAEWQEWSNFFLGL